MNEVKINRDYLSTLVYLTKNVIIHVRQSYEWKNAYKFKLNKQNFLSKVLLDKYQNM